MAKFAKVKRIQKIKRTAKLDEEKAKAQTKLKSDEQGNEVRHVARPNASFFFEHNKALGPPYHVIVDTNFINKSIQMKIEIVRGVMDCLFSRCFLYITDCVVAEIEKLGPKYRIALTFARDENIFERLPCMHKGTYADDCILSRVASHPCFIVATNDKELKSRIRKLPGIPIMYVAKYKYSIERLPEGMV
ncbi:rRNA-processing protein fcf1 [Mitosporidium daphniae]|uniref:PIN domain-containing protein n=1 Tax=Mitosporidium daphniae TaxID=1485682 RepID=A0A098VQJ2_9MICR|nr:uncharacterized protein DI09_3p20 [Mitosporidium daphniae]KGG51240.1 hypothetical protein DI09_3p20 [Mitosporidium daphniae]|eukprot:XP_013237735.1 uncharacterized protein DI09_3p20 [Mitosporidium daphniae]